MLVGSVNFQMTAKYYIAIYFYNHDNNEFVSRVMDESHGTQPCVTLLIQKK